MSVELILGLTITLIERNSNTSQVTMDELEHLFVNNKEWALQITQRDATFFNKLAKQQAPQYLWIGCADSRVPANEIVGLLPGELFVHRNVANVVVHTDFNCLSVLQYAIEVLKVKHVIICGHYGCGGIAAAMDNKSYGLIDNWLMGVKEHYLQNFKYLSKLSSYKEQLNKMCELNVKEQVRNLCHTTIVQDAWQRGHPLSVHGWIYGIEDGLLRDLSVTVDGPNKVDPIFRVINENGN